MRAGSPLLFRACLFSSSHPRHVSHSFTDSPVSRISKWVVVAVPRVPLLILSGKVTPLLTIHVRLGALNARSSLVEREGDTALSDGAQCGIGEIGGIPARRSTLIPSTPLRGTPRAAALRSFSGDSKGSSLALVLYFLVLYSLCFVMFSHYVSRAHFPTLSGRSCPRARHEMLYGLRRKKEQSLSARCTEPARCTVASKLSIVTRSGFRKDLIASPEKAAGLRAPALGRRGWKRTEYFAPVGPGTPVLVPGFQWSGCPIQVFICGT
jgi:hypothetical protein